MTRNESEQEVDPLSSSCVCVCARACVCVLDQESRADMSSSGAGSSLQVHVIRLGPGQGLVSSLQTFVQQKKLRAPFIVTCVGSVTTATLRLANATATDADQVMHLSGPHEIVSLVGTLNPVAHLHVCLSDGEGRTFGGHVLGDMDVFTTAEVVVGEAVELDFSREMDERTGFPELVVRSRSDAQKTD